MKKILITVCALALLTGCSGTGKDGSGSHSAASSALITELAQQGNTVYFAYDRSNLSTEAKTTLRKQSDLMKRNGSVAFAVEGHCDQRGTVEYNIALGERRANAVKQFLINEGVSNDKLTVISYGKEKLLDAGTTPESYAKNRRAVTVAQ